MRGVDSEEFKEKYSCFDETDLKKLADQGYAMKKDGKWYLTSKGIAAESVLML